ncbi:MAG: branched-chain amino acid ABC transporter permease [Acidimicrobiales bacterium]
MRLFEYALVSGVLYGLFYGFIGVGLNLLFGVMRLVNLAHGDLVVWGGYFAYSLTTSAHVNALWAIPLSIPLSLVGGLILYLITVPRLRRSEDTETSSLILFFGVSQVLEALATMKYGTNQVTLPQLGNPVTIFGQPYAASLVASAALAVPALALFYFYLYRTRLGLATRAVMANEEEAIASGVRVRRVATSAFVIGVAFAAAAGPLATFMLGGINPTTGGGLTITAFTIIIIGSLGNPLGTAAGGILYGLASSLTQAYATQWTGLVPYVLLLAVVLLRPSGLFGRRVRIA